MVAFLWMSIAIKEKGLFFVLVMVNCSLEVLLVEGVNIGKGSVVFFFLISIEIFS
jgi:hypothetical protein